METTEVKAFPVQTVKEHIDAVMVGDKLTVLDYHTSIAPLAYPILYFVTEIQDDYFVVRKRRFDNRETFLLPKSCRHIVVEKFEKR